MDVCMLFLVNKFPDKSLHPQHSFLWDYAMIKSKNIKKIDAIFQANSYISHSQKQPPRITCFQSLKQKHKKAGVIFLTIEH